MNKLSIVVSTNEWYKKKNDQQNLHWGWQVSTKFCLVMLSMDVCINIIYVCNICGQSLNDAIK
jgi:hypothetical protein